MAQPLRTPNGKSEQETKDDAKGANGKPSVTLSGTVEKVIPSIHPSEPDKAQIALEGADHLYREIRVPNRLQDASGKEVALTKGAEVDVTIEADSTATTEKAAADTSKEKKA